MCVLACSLSGFVLDYDSFGSFVKYLGVGRTGVLDCGSSSTFATDFCSFISHAQSFSFGHKCVLHCSISNIFVLDLAASIALSNTSTLAARAS